MFESGSEYSANPLVPSHIRINYEKSNSEWINLVIKKSNQVRIKDIMQSDIYFAPNALTKVQKPFFEPDCLILKLYDADKVSQLQTGISY